MNVTDRPLAQRHGSYAKPAVKIPLFLDEVTQLLQLHKVRGEIYRWCVLSELPIEESAGWCSGWATAVLGISNNRADHHEWVVIVKYDPTRGRTPFEHIDEVAKMFNIKRQ